MDSRALISLLSDGLSRSKAALAAELGWSMQALEDGLSTLPAIGVSVEVQDCEVRLSRAIDLLSAGHISSLLSGKARVAMRDIHCEWIVDSTNQMALRGIEHERRHGHVYLAEQQSAGRGRRGRQWVSPFASNVAMSVVWEFAPATKNISALSLAVGVAVCRALRSLGVDDVGLKWPNDILAQGKKLGGILLEMQGDPSRVFHVVMGIGLNVSMPPLSEQDISQPWSDIGTLLHGNAPQRNVVVAALLEALTAVLEEFEQQGFAGLRAEWQLLDVYANADVVIQQGEDYLLGVARGVDESGALCLDTATGRQTFHGGEVSLRPKGVQ